MTLGAPCADAFVPVALGDALAGKVPCPPEVRQAVIVHRGGAYCRRAPVFVDAEAVPAELRGTLDLYVTRTVQAFKPIHLAHLTPALVGGQGTVALPCGALVKETVLEYLAQGKPPDLMVRAGDDGYRFVEPVSRTISAPAVLAQRPWFRNFGHWLVDGAALVAMLAETDLPAGTQIVIGAQTSEALRRIVHETLSVLRPDVQVLEHPEDETWRFEHLLYVTPTHIPPLFKLPLGLQRLQDAFLAGWEAPSSGRRKLFALRDSNAVPRRLLNEDEIVEVCAARGFETVRPERMSLVEQARLFASADAIIGVKGAALTNALFSRPDCALMVLSPSDFIDPFFWDIAGQKGLTYGEAFGAVTSTARLRSHNPFQVSPEQVVRMLDAVLPVP